MNDQEKLQTEILQSRDTLASIQRHVRSCVQRILNAGRKISKLIGIGSLIAITGCGAMSKSTSQEETMQTMRDLVTELGRNRAGLQDDGRVLNCGEHEELDAAQSQSENANTEILGPGTKTTGIATRKAGKKWIVCSIGEVSGSAAPDTASPVPASVEEARQRLLNEYGRWPGGKAPVGRIVVYGEGNSPKEAENDARKKLPEESSYIGTHTMKIKDGRFVGIAIAKVPYLPATIEEARQRLLNEFGYKAEGKQSDGWTVVQFGEGNTHTEAEINAIKKLPNGYSSETKGYIKTKSDKIIALIIGAPSEGKKPQPETPSTPSANDDFETDYVHVKVTNNAPKKIIERVHQLITQNYEILHACYLKELEKQPSLQGKLTMKLQISPYGKVKRVTFPKDGKTIDNKKIENCIERIAKTWIFPKQPKGSIYQYPFVLLGKDFKLIIFPEI